MNQEVHWCIQNGKGHAFPQILSRCGHTPTFGPKILSPARNDNPPVAVHR